MRAGDAGDAVAEALDDAFEVHGDHRLVLDDEHVGRDLRRDLAAGEIDQLIDLGDVDIEDLRRLGRRETFHGAEQKGLARQRRDRFELAVDRGRGGAPAPRA